MEPFNFYLYPFLEIIAHLFTFNAVLNAGQFFWRGHPDPFIRSAGEMFHLLTLVTMSYNFGRRLSLLLARTP